MICFVSALVWSCESEYDSEVLMGGSSLTCKEGALLPTLLCSLQRYYPNITIIWDGRICMFAVLLRFTLSFVYKVYIGFLSRMRDWTVAVAQYTANLFVKVQYIFENMAV